MEEDKESEDVKEHLVNHRSIKTKGEFVKCHI